MKKIILSFVFANLFISCKEETQEKLEAAQDAVRSEVKENIDSAKAKAEKELDSAKQNVKAKVDTVVIKSAEKLESAAKKMKETVKK